MCEHALTHEKACCFHFQVVDCGLLSQAPLQSSVMERRLPLKSLKAAASLHWCNDLALYCTSVTFSQILLENQL